MENFGILLMILILVIVALVVSLILSIAALIIALVALSRARRALAAHPPQPAPEPQPAPATQATPAPANADAPIAPEILAVIAAAVSMVCGPNARIAGVQPAVATDETIAQLWALEGRRALHSTHRPR